MSGRNANPVIYSNALPSSSSSSSSSGAGASAAAAASPSSSSSSLTFAAPAIGASDAATPSRSFLLPILCKSDLHWAPAGRPAPLFPTATVTKGKAEVRASPIVTAVDTAASSATATSTTSSAAVPPTTPAHDAFTAAEIFNIIRRINDPEHPLTLEQLNVVQLALCDVDDARSRVHIDFTPTIPHCSMATLIGLSIMTKLIRSLPLRFKISVGITPGTHNQEGEVNKQLADKERVAAALETAHLLKVVNGCIKDTDGAWPAA
jgi:metal-sulfur cluster biosynthetic enzyme